MFEKLNKVEECKNLSDELGLSEPRSLNVSIELEPVKHSIEEWKLKELELERKINLQKLKITSDLLEVKKKEVFFCRIYNNKHNFRKSICQELSNKHCPIN